ncbi:hemagglutinin repeat-containing protein [Xanthomonas oryzae]|uniref:hemagglutinin repeat-containing protein n=1 Tax=Xanthomonas oryzae TaxID=347 RepID=UPI001F5F4BBA|nr:hemagglutinin repeat-containing protein [Xanthomonas oryzae]
MTTAYNGTTRSWSNPSISEQIGQVGGALTSGGTLTIDVGNLSNLNQGRDAPNVQAGAAVANLNIRGAQAAPTGPGRGSVGGAANVSVDAAGRIIATVTQAANGNVGGAVNNVANNGPVNGARGVTAAGGSPDRIVMGTPDTRAPTGSLFTLRPAAGHYLVETDPQFADYRSWLGSDYLLNQMGYSADRLQKRLGDGYYEQKLVREQIGQLTGRRFLEGYKSDEAQYQALLDAGATIGKAWNLRPGIALTQAQMAQLTSDIVWLVEQTVTLPDGSTTTALVPQVYLRLRPGDLEAGGALLAGANVDVTLAGGLKNTGTIAGRQLVSIDAGRIEHLGGSISGDQVGLRSASDIRIEGASVTAVDALSVQAAGDVTVASTVETLQGGGFHQYSTTQIQRVAGLYVTGTHGNGVLSVVAGHDVTLQAAQIRNAGTDGVTQLVAGNNLNVGTQTLSHSTSTTANARNFQRSSDITHLGTTVQGAGSVVLAAGNDLTLTAAQVGAGKSLALQAGRDINSVAAVDSSTSASSTVTKSNSLATSSYDESVRGTQLGAGDTIVMQAGRDLTLASTAVASEKGGIALAAGNDIKLLSTQEQHDAVVDQREKKSGFLSSKTTSTHDESHDSLAVTSSLSGDTVQIAAGHDVLSQGAQIAGTGDVVVAAGNDLTLETAQDTHSEEHAKQVKKSGLYSGGGFSVTLGQSKQADTLSATEVSHHGSLVGSTDGSVTLTAGNAVTIRGSDVLSKTDTVIVGKDVTIAAVTDTRDSEQTSKQQSAGLSLGLTGAAVQAAEAAYGAIKRGSEVKDDRLKALYAAKAGYAVKDSVDAYQAASAQGDSTGGVSLRIGIGASSASSKTVTHEESTVGSRILSDGNVTIAATGGDLNVIGSKISGENVALGAAHNLNLLSQQENNTSKSENKNAGGEVGVSVGATTGYYVSVSAGKGSAKGNSVEHTDSVVTATDTLTLVSGNDTTIKGAQAVGNKVLANVGGNLLIQSEQDTNDYKSKQQQASLTLATGSGSSGSYSQQKVNSSYTGVKEQSGIQAGSGGFDVSVGGNTHLVGGAIASTADPSLNHLSTGSLTVEDLQNKAEYKAGGFGVGTGDWKSAAAGAALSLAGNQNGSSSSTTKSDIAAGSVEVRNGDTSALAGLDRTAKQLQQSGLKQIFDEKKVAERQELAQVAGEVAFRSAKELISFNRKQAAADAEKAMSDLDAAKGDPEATAAAQARLNAANQRLEKWNDAGAAKQITQVTAGVLAAALSDGNVLSAAGGVLMNETLLPKFAKALQQGGIAPGSGTESTLMNGLGALLGAAGGILGGDAQAGAAMGNAVQTYGYYDYRDGRAQRQEMAAAALANAGITDPNDVAGVNTLLDNCVKLGCDPNKLVLLLKSPDAASTLRQLAQPESVSFQLYGRGFNELDEQQRKDVINHIPTGNVTVGVSETTPTGDADGTTLGAGAVASSDGAVDSQQSRDESLRLKGAKVVSNLAIAGGEKVEQFKNWMGEDNAQTAALLLMAATGGPVKTLASTLWAETPMAKFLQDKKEQVLVGPMTPLVGSNAFGAQNDSDQEAVRPASHATSSMLVDTLLSSIGLVGAKAGAVGIIKSSDGFSGAVKNAENTLEEGSSDLTKTLIIPKEKAEFLDHYKAQADAGTLERVNPADVRKGNFRKALTDEVGPPPGTGYHADHIVELCVGGANCAKTNGNWLESGRNTAAGAKIGNQVKNDPVGTKYTNVKLEDNP